MITFKSSTSKTTGVRSGDGKNLHAVGDVSDLHKSWPGNRGSNTDAACLEWNYRRFHPIARGERAVAALGTWLLTLVGNSGGGNFSVGLHMMRAEAVNWMTHTHHVTLSDAQVTPLENGFEIRGPATITSNGNLAGFSGSTVTVSVTGGNAIPFSNITLTFEDGAVAHFGDQPLQAW